MDHSFDKGYWETHWHDADPGEVPPNPALDAEIDSLPPGTALEAGSGEGAEARWLAAHGWDVTAADISSEAIRRARERPAPVPGSITWVEADLTTWEPERTYDLVTTFYAHPTIPQLDFYQRISRWVAPGGTLLIVGHQGGDGKAHGGAHVHGDGHAHVEVAHDGHREFPQHATTSPEVLRGAFAHPEWEVQTAESRERMSWRGMLLRDVVLVARRRP